MLAQIIQTAWIMDLAILAERIGEGCPILSDVEFGDRILLVQAQEQFVQPCGVDLPTHFCVFRVLWIYLFDTLWRTICSLACNEAEVIVDAQEIERTRNNLGIARFSLRGQVT